MQYCNNIDMAINFAQWACSREGTVKEWETDQNVRAINQRNLQGRSISAYEDGNEFSPQSVRQSYAAVGGRC